MIIGFVLLVSACGFDACEAMPVSDDLYLTEESCILVLDAIHERRPAAVLMCGAVWREDGDEQKPAN
ncbi:hypothetical protein AB6D37_16345 [Pectobacterium brasiliense]|uniref:hypothetical protein n=1 Tax=Pectobacterium TaxID=122277 RepID=UPI000DE55001|nr:hypothetical protein [Pectobacterium peruviense]